MNLNINNHFFIIGGASSGLGRGIAETLLKEGASILAIGRNPEKLALLKSICPEQIETFTGDLTKEGTIEQVYEKVKGRQIHGIVVNAGGPPAKTTMETTLEDWDNAYKNLLRWKVVLVKKFIPAMVEKKYGRILFIESASIKQPMENLVLSTSLRLAVIGFAKTLSEEIAASGVTLNILAPGAHNTEAIKRIHLKKSEQTGIPIEQIREEGGKEIPVGFLGNAENFGSLGSWLLSPHSAFITGQTISVDGGTIKGIFG